MKTKDNVTIYQCDFCKKKLQVKRAMELHEVICSKNPLNMKPCMDFCQHLERKKTVVPFLTGYDYQQGGALYDDREIEIFHCSKLDKDMFPYSIERKNLHNRFPETYDEQEPMPSKCEDYQEPNLNF